MRFWLASLLIALLPGLSFAAERKKLPDFFLQSFEAVEEQPLTPYEAGRAEETGAIDGTFVPEPPPRPEVKMASTPQRTRRTRRLETSASRQRQVAAVSPKEAPPPGTSAEAASLAAQSMPRPAAPAPPLPTLTPATQKVAALIPASKAIAPKPDPSPAASASKEAFTVKVPANVRVKDATSFVVDNRRYQLASTEGLGVNTKCVQQANGRCIRRPMRSLKEAIAGRTLQCRPASDGAGERLACTR